MLRFLSALAILFGAIVLPVALSGNAPPIGAADATSASAQAGSLRLPAPDPATKRAIRIAAGTDAAGEQGALTPQDSFNRTVTPQTNRPALRLVRDNGSGVQQSRGPATASAGGLASIPIVDIAESVLVRFQGYQDLSGKYRINEDQTISVPGLGRVNVSDASAEELERLLSRRILEMIGRESLVSVEVDVYRDVFVTGEVANAGAIKWFRGLTVLKAVSAAGGFYRGEEKDERAEVGTSRVEMTVVKLAQSIARYERLQSQLNQRRDIKMSSRLIQLVGAKRARQMVASESLLLGSRQRSRAASLKAVNASITATNTEIARLKDLKVSLEARRTKLADLVAQLQDAHSRRVVTNERLLSAETTLAALDERSADTTVRLSGAVADLQKLLRDRIELTEELRAELSTELADSRNTVEQLETELLLQEREASKLVLTGGDVVTTFVTSYEIVRNQRNQPRRFVASELDLLHPGDTLIVKRTKTVKRTATQQAATRDPMPSVAAPTIAGLGNVAPVVRGAQVVRGARAGTEGSQTIRARLIPPLPAPGPRALRVRQGKAAKPGNRVAFGRS